jgi:hypothetical protein
MKTENSSGRKIISYIGTDPAGGLSLLTGYTLMEQSAIASIPFFLFSAWHIPKMVRLRKRLNNATKKDNGLSEKVLEPFNKNSWCSHRVAIAYTYGEGKYKNFKELFHKYSTKYYLKKLGENIKNEVYHTFNLKNNSE